MDFRETAERELSALRERYAFYDRKAAFGENPYVRFFKKFKKTYPVLLQFESVVCKGHPFPFENYVTAVPFLLEMTAQVLSGTHDADCIEGGLTLFLSGEKLPFTGLRGATAAMCSIPFSGRRTCRKTWWGRPRSGWSHISESSRLGQRSRRQFYRKRGHGMKQERLAGRLPAGVVVLRERITLMGVENGKA